MKLQELRHLKKSVMEIVHELDRKIDAMIHKFTQEEIIAIGWGFHNHMDSEWSTYKCGDLYINLSSNGHITAVTEYGPVALETIEELEEYTRTGKHFLS